MLCRRPHKNGQFTNPSDRFDVSGDGRVAPIDALLAIHELNTHGARLLLGPHQDPPYFDVSDDDYVTALDVLQVINRLNDLADDGLAGEPLEALVAEGEASWFPGSAWERTALPAGCEAEPRGQRVTGQSPVTRSDSLAAILATLVNDQDLILQAKRDSGVELDDAWELDLLDLDLEPLVADLVGVSNGEK